MVTVIEPDEGTEDEESSKRFSTDSPHGGSVPQLSLETMEVVGSEEAVEVNGVLSAGGYRTHVLLPLTDHGPLQ